MIVPQQSRPFSKPLRQLCSASILAILALLLLKPQVYSDDASSQTSQLIDRKRTTVGLEVTFQDKEMAIEKGNLFATSHKISKMNEMIRVFETKKLLGGPIEVFNYRPRFDFKPGKMILGAGRKLIVDMEPGVLEWNQPPVTNQNNNIQKTWAPVFLAAKEANLVPYVYPVGQSGGGGHIHIGGLTPADNPFLVHPLLLRNLMAYEHQHPSLLWGFSEGYDVGKDSSVESFHEEDSQNAFKEAVTEFDHWYDQANESERSDGALKFLVFLTDAGMRHKRSNLFGHDIFINAGELKARVLPLTSNDSLESMLSKATTQSAFAKLGNQVGYEHGMEHVKFTVELRNFRPPKNEKQAQANVDLVFTLLDRMARRGFRVPVKTISQAEFNQFRSVSVVEQDWNSVKKELELPENRYWNAEISEYVDYQNDQATIVRDGLETLPAYSEASEQGNFREYRLPVDKFPSRPQVKVDGMLLHFDPVIFRSKKYWVSVVRKPSHGGFKRVAALIRASVLSMCLSDSWSNELKSVH